MQAEHFAPNNPHEWLNRARSNLLRAKSRIPGVYLEDLCFDAQQAAEKAIKAVLIKKGVDFPYVHDISQLLTLVEETGGEVLEAIRKAEELTPYAVVTRYPGLAEPVTEAHYQEAIESAEAVVQWAEEQIQEVE